MIMAQQVRVFIVMDERLHPLVVFHIQHKAHIHEPRGFLELAEPCWQSREDVPHFRLHRV
jgi:hypothetical protein